MISEELNEALLSERGFKVGTKRTWADGTFTKTTKGWINKATGKLRGSKGAGGGGAGGDKEPAGGGEAPEKGPGLKQKAKDAVAGAKEKVSIVSKGLLARIKGLPKDAQKLVTDRDHRAEMGKKMGEALKRKSTNAVKNVVGELKELKDGGAALKKLTMRQKLTAHDKAAIKGSAKAIGMTIAGTIAMGGIGHVTAAALGTHFAAETLIKHVGRAALFADLQRTGWPIYESDEDAIREVVERVIAKVTKQLEGLGSMSDEEIAAILGGKGQSTASDDGDDEAKDDDRGGDDEGGEKTKGERDWKPGDHNRVVKK